MINTIQLPPFKKMCVTIGNLPSSFMESMSYYEALCWLTNYLANDVVPAVNTNSEALTELQTYVATYFDNLDVQEEINNKLDAMAESGELEEIITSYLQISGILSFDTISDMKTSDKLIDGTTCRTLGYYSANDGGAGLYKIREITNDDVVDEGSIISLDDDNLIAELIIDKNVNIKQFGAYGDSTHDDSSYFQNVITYVKSKQFSYQPNNRAYMGYNIEIVIPTGKYLINNPVIIDLQYLNLKGKNAILYSNDNNKNILTINNSGYDNVIDGIQFVGGYNQIEINDTSNKDHSKLLISNCKFWIANNYSIKAYDQSCILKVTSSYFYQNKYIYESTMIDKTIFDACWFSEASRTANKDYSIKLLSGINTFVNCFFIPNGLTADSTLYSETCWIENHAMVTVDKCRISNETGVKTLINNYAKVDFNPTTQALGQNTEFGVINIINNPMITSYTDTPIVRLYEMPRSIIIENNNFPINDFKFIDFSSEFDLATFKTNGLGVGELSTNTNYVINYIIKNNSVKNHLPYTKINLYLKEFIRCDRDVEFTFTDNTLEIPLIHKYIATNDIVKTNYLVKGIYRPDQNSNSASMFIGILGFDIQDSGKITTKFNIISKMQGGNATTQASDIVVTPTFKVNNTNQVTMASQTYQDLTVVLTVDTPFNTGILYTFEVM